MRYLKTTFIPIFSSVVYLIPGVIFAQIQITEIMYDVPGTDTGREWIEIFNVGAENINPTDFRFLENQVNHKINFPDNYTGNQTIESQQYAVIADNIDKFKADYPDYSGILLDSAFSLSNQGENLSVTDSENNIIHSVNYMPDWGGQGTGNSLQYLDGNWIPAIPTPGALNHSESIDETHTDDNDDNTGSSNDSNSNSSSNSNSDSDSTHSGQNGLSFEDAATNLKIGAGRTRYCIINTPIDFLAISNFNRDDHRKIKFNWSFGDADSKKGFSPDHTYYTAGGYNVVLNGKYNDSENMDQNATTRITVIIREPQISIDLIKSGKHVDILLNNESNFEVNFGGFYFKLNDEALFKIPNDTILSANSQITIAGEISNFQINPDMPEIIIKMYYPNGKFLAKESLGGSSVKVDSQTINLIRNLLDKENLQNFDLLIRNLNI